MAWRKSVAMRSFNSLTAVHWQESLLSLIWVCKVGCPDAAAATPISTQPKVPCTGRTA